MPENAKPASFINLAFDSGVIAERTRIIKLLEDPVVMSNWWSQVDKNLGLYGNLKNYVIALIKGKAE